jgi:hypothetical protein
VRPLLVGRQAQDDVFDLVPLDQLADAEDVGLGRAHQRAGDLLRRLVEDVEVGRRDVPAVMTSLSGSTFLLNLNRANRFSTLNVPSRTVDMAAPR